MRQKEKLAFLETISGEEEDMKESDVKLRCRRCNHIFFSNGLQTHEYEGMDEYDCDAGHCYVDCPECGADVSFWDTVEAGK